jgi:hypothetical protein
VHRTCSVLQLDTSGRDSVMTNSQLLQYIPPNSGAPLAFVITEFHALLLYADHVKGISLLNHELVFEDVYNEVQFCLSVSIYKTYIEAGSHNFLVLCPEGTHFFILSQLCYYTVKLWFYALGFIFSPVSHISLKS